MGKDHPVTNGKDNCIPGNVRGPNLTEHHRIEAKSPRKQRLEDPEETKEKEFKLTKV